MRINGSLPAGTFIAVVGVTTKPSPVPGSNVLGRGMRVCGIGFAGPADGVAGRGATRAGCRHHRD